MQHTALRMMPSTTQTCCLRVGQIGVRCPDHQVKVVLHQVIGVQQELKQGDDAIADPKSSLSVLIVPKDVLSGVAAGGDVVACTTKCDAQWAGHGT